MRTGEGAGPQGRSDAPGPGDSGETSSPSELYPAHAAELETEHAIRPEIAAEWVVSDGPDMQRFRWTAGDRTEWELRRGEQARAAAPDAPRYQWLGGKPLLINRLREPIGDAPILLIEGNCQPLAVLSWAPEEWGVYAVHGCRGWSGLDLSWAKGRDVVVVFDADQSSNRDVYDAAAGLRDALKLDRAASIRFAKVPGVDSVGVDDVLAAHPPETRREWLERLIEAADDDLGSRPRAKPAKAKPYASPDGRPPLDVTDEAAVLDWLKSTGGIGYGRLAGLFARGDHVVFVPREGEDGYVPLTDRETHPDDHDGPAQVHAVDPERLAADLDHGFGVHKQFKAGPRPGLFPGAVARRALAKPEKLTGLRRLRSVVHTPVFRPDGSLVDQAGWDAATGRYYAPTVDVPPVPDRPSPGELATAVEMMKLLVVDFPFVSESHRANWIGAFLTPLLGPLAPPPYKMPAVDSHQPGSGKTLLCKLPMWTYGGVFRSEVPRDDAELAKQITAILATTTAPNVILDNLDGTLRSPKLAGLLTTAQWDDRTLGRTKMGGYVNDRVWWVNGNNLSIAGDLPRRALPIKIDADMPHPETRTNFAVKNLAARVQANRGLLIHAGLVIVRSWVAEGRQLGAEVTSDDYTLWQRTLAGIFAHAGIEGGFDASAVQLDTNDEDDELAGFIDGATLIGADEWSIRDYLDRVSTYDSDPKPIPLEALPTELAERIKVTPSSISKALGLWVKRREGRWAGDRCLRSRYDTHRKLNLWHIATYGRGSTGSTGSDPGRSSQKSSPKGETTVSVFPPGTVGSTPAITRTPADPAAPPPVAVTPPTADDLTPAQAELLRKLQSQPLPTPREDRTP